MVKYLGFQMLYDLVRIYSFIFTKELGDSGQSHMPIFSLCVKWVTTNLFGNNQINIPSLVLVQDTTYCTGAKNPKFTTVKTSDGSGLKMFCPGSGWVGSIFCSSGWVSHLWFGFGKFPLKMSIFFPSRKKKILRVGSKAFYLLRVKSMLESGIITQFTCW